MMKLYISLAIVTSALIGALTLPAAHASAFDAGRIIDDGVFTDASSMNPSQIQQFLNSKVPVCDTNGTQISEFGGGTRAQWGQANYGQSTFTCLKDYVENSRSSAQIIYDASQQFGISPKVLLILLQKEQSLVTDTWPLNIQYRSATGYGCPDTAACDSQYYGLTNQVTWAARMFRAIINDSPTWYTPYNLGNNFIRYSPDSSCGGSTVNITNRATQALYNYTPYQPNAGAIAAGWGQAPCGAYGNRNFYLYYTNWFGSTTTTPSYGYTIISRDIYSDAGYTNKISSAPTVEPGSNFYVKLIIKNTGNQVWSKDNLNIGSESPQNRYSSFATSGWINPGRPAAMAEASVREGELATFTFQMKAPQDLGDYREAFGVLIEGQRWLNGVFTIPVTVASASPYYAVKNVSFETFADSAMTRKNSSSSLSLYTGGKTYVKAVVKNTGNQPLPANSTKIATAGPTDRISVYSDNSWMTTNRVAVAASGAIAPQQTGTFTFSLTAPSTQQVRTQEQFGMLIEGQRWLSENIGSMSVQTNKRPPSELTTNQTIEIGQSLLSYDERYTLILQGDGNLVLYSPSRALWSTGTVGQGGVRLIMQSDGNLVLYRANWTAVWNSQTSGHGPSKIIPQTDGNLVIYTTAWQPTWYTSTGGQQ